MIRPDLTSHFITMLSRLLQAYQMDQEKMANLLLIPQVISNENFFVENILEYGIIILCIYTLRAWNYHNLLLQILTMDEGNNISNISNKKYLMFSFNSYWNQWSGSILISFILDSCIRPYKKPAKNYRKISYDKNFIILLNFAFPFIL